MTMKTIFHFNCVICGAHPQEQNIEDFIWPPSSERLKQLLSIVKGILEHVENCRWKGSRDFLEALRKLHSLIKENAITKLNIFRGFSTCFSIECPLCGTPSGPRPFDRYFRAWFAWNLVSGVQIANFLYEMWYLLKEIPEAIKLVAAFDAAITAIGWERCINCGRPTGTLYGGWCRWCIDTVDREHLMQEKTFKIPLHLTKKKEGDKEYEISLTVKSGVHIGTSTHQERGELSAEGEYISFLQSLAGNDLLGAGINGWETVRTAIIRDVQHSGHKGTSYLFMALACHPVSAWLAHWNSVLNREHCTPTYWRNPSLFNPPHVPLNLGKVWEMCRDLPVEANESLYLWMARKISPDMASYLESRGLAVRGSPDDLSGFLNGLSMDRVREISNRLGTGKGRTKADIIDKILNSTTPQRFSAIVPEINELWIKELRTPFDGLPNEWLNYVAGTVQLINAYVRAKFRSWKILQTCRGIGLNFVLDVDSECPSFCRQTEHRIEKKTMIPQRIPPWFPGCGCALRCECVGEDEATRKLSRATVGMKVRFEIDEYREGSAKIESLDLEGSISKSADGRYYLMYSDYDSNGWWMLIDDRRIAAMGYMTQPRYGAVANNGTFVLSNWESDSENGGTFWAIDKSGKTLVRRTCTANIGNTCISSDGVYAACSLLSSENRFDAYSRLPSKTADSGAVVLFNLNNGQTVQFYPGLYVENFQIDEKKHIIEITSRKGPTFRFNFKGELLDDKAFREATIENANGYSLIVHVMYNMRHDLTVENEASYFELLNKALEKGVNPNWQGTAYMIMGEIHERAGRLSEAIKMYETALLRNPRLTIKRHLKEMKERITRTIAP